MNTNMRRRAALFAAFALCAAGALVSCTMFPTTAQTPVETTPGRIAITLDDLPYVMPSRFTPAQGRAQVAAINASLAAHNITATGFAVGQNVNAGSIPALQAFADAGHAIGNHSWSHPDYGTLTAAQFRDETQRTDDALSPWLTQPKYYRFPFLREGETAATKAAAKQVLRDLGYQNAPVTIDNDDWKLNADYIDAVKAGRDARAARIATTYLAHMQERTAHFQALAQEAVGRDVDHVLLLHLNQINADHLGSLLAWYAAQGWTFISLEEALRDPIYAAPDLYPGPRGLSQIERVMGRASDE